MEVYLVSLAFRNITYSKIAGLSKYYKQFLFVLKST